MIDDHNDQTRSKRTTRPGKLAIIVLAIIGSVGIGAFVWSRRSRRWRP